MHKSITIGMGAGLIAYTFIDSCLEFLTFCGPSMEPTIFEKDVGIGEKITSYAKLKRGDIVTVTAHNKPSVRVCKRIIALEGDKVSYTSSFQREDRESCDFSVVKRFIPRGHVWLEGDNSAESLDSRQYGPIPIGLVRSRVVVKIFPFSNMKFFSSIRDEK